MKRVKTFSFFFLINIVVPAFSQSNDFDGYDFSKADSVAGLYTNYDLGDEKKLVSLLTSNFDSDLDKFRAIFKWITSNISYDLDLYHENLKKERALKYNKTKLDRWRTSFHKKAIRKLFQNKSTICSGYASLLESMCGIAGITCQVVSGFGRSPNIVIGTGGEVNHSWNAVFINKRWYLCDATWASGYVNEEETKFRREFNSFYFLASPEIFALNHYPKNKNWLLMQNPPSLKEFLFAPHRSIGFRDNKLNAFSPNEGILHLKGDSIMNFSFTSNLPHDSIKTVTVQVYKFKNRNLEFHERKIHFVLMNKQGFHEFSVKLKEKGHFILRVYLRQRLTFIYEAFIK